MRKQSRTSGLSLLPYVFAAAFIALLAACPPAQKRVSGVSLNKTTTTIDIGYTEQLVATIAPVDAVSQDLTWTTSDAAVAAVDAAGLVTVPASAADGQTATITVTTVDGGFSASCAVTAAFVAATGVSLDMPVIGTVPGGPSVHERLKATVSPPHATNKALTWQTNNSSMASVDASGLVTVAADRADGQTAIITVSTQDGGFTAACAVNVMDFPPHRAFNSIDCTDESMYSVPATRRAEGTHCVVYVEDERLADVSEAEAAAICAEFDGNIYSMMRTNYANESDVDDNQKVIFLLQDILDGFSGSGGYVAGFFYPVNQFDADTEPDSNEADMLYLDVYPAVPGSAGFYGTIAHEFQHLINFSNTYMEDGNEQEIWINEGLSSGAEFLYAGAQVADRIDYFNADPLYSIRNGNNFLVWNGYWENPRTNPNPDALANYSTVYLFFQWLQLHASNGTAIYGEILSSDYRDYRCVTDSASSRIDAAYADWETLMRTWQIANLLCSDAGDYGYLGAIDVAARHLNSTSGRTNAFSPGEGIFSLSSGGTYAPAPGSGTHIRYVGINTGTGALDTTSPHAGDVVLVFNANSSAYDPDENGFLANAIASRAESRSIRSVAYAPPDLSRYPIDVSFGPDGAFSPDSHRPGKAKEGAIDPAMVEGKVMK